MKGLTLYLFFFFSVGLCAAQGERLDSLKQVLATTKEDSNRVNTLLQLSREQMVSAPAEAVRYSIEARNLARQIDDKSSEAFALKNIGLVYYNQTKYVEAIDYWNQSYHLFDSLRDKSNAARLLSNIGSIYMNEGDDATALSYYFKSLQLGEEIRDDERIASAMGNIGSVYSNNEITYDKALSYYLKALAISEKLNDNNIIGGLMVNIGEIYLNRNKDDSALYYFKQSLQAYAGTENIPYSLNDIGKTYTKKGNYTLAKQYHQQAVSFAMKLDLQLDMAQSYLGLGYAYYMESNYSEALNAYKTAQIIASRIKLKKELRDAYRGLTDTYAALQDYNNAFKFQTLYTNLKDSLFNLDVAQKVNNLQTNFDIQKKQGQIDILIKDQALQKAELNRQKFVRNTLVVGLLLLFSVMFVLSRLYYQVRRRRTQLRRSLEELRSTQAQLIQSEKMASLGTLTAGIAHEIQNPLNFVNNFSETNAELIDELQHELEKGDLDEVKLIANDIKGNEQKIMQHGRRADSIVKGMLQHSRISSGQKERIDINNLADEYLRLSYHGLRAKDKSFNAFMQTKFDKSVGKITIVPQDIGRVLLNLFNNAFYTVQEKKQNAVDGYEPTVSVSTRKLSNKIELTVKDNGMGISKTALEKIFQPFFTTKPSGEGTGLGLSMSYDIIKAHGGDIKVDTKEGEGTTFIILLPMQ